MELKPGYKQTEVGVIPEDWVVSSVDEKGQVVAGKALVVNAPGKQRSYLRTKNVFDGNIDIEDVLFIAAALDELDALLKSLEAAITKKTALKQAAM